MNNLSVISFTLEGDFGFLRKPETNEGVQLSYNMLHKPALLGILGAIVGLSGYQQRGKWPEYYQKLKNTRIGIAPQIGKHEKGNFHRTVLTYTNGVGYANADGNLIVTESTLLNLGFEVFIQIEPDNEWHSKLANNLLNGTSVFQPYIGKNECFAWWDKDSVEQYETQPFSGSTAFAIDSIFFKEQAASSQRDERGVGFILDKLDSNDFLYFERLPIGFDEQLRQYEYADFAYSNCKWHPNSGFEQLYELRSRQKHKVIQLF